MIDEIKWQNIVLRELAQIFQQISGCLQKLDFYSIAFNDSVKYALMNHRRYEMNTFTCKV